jgi:hypothetical protein
MEMIIQGGQALIALPAEDSKGTKDMMEKARLHGLPVYAPVTVGALP